MPIIRKVIKDADEFILGKAVKVYFEKKKWQQDKRKTSDQAVQASAEVLGKQYGLPPCKRKRASTLLNLAGKSESESNIDECSDFEEGNMSNIKSPTSD